MIYTGIVLYFGFGHFTDLCERLTLMLETTIRNVHMGEHVVVGASRLCL